MIRACVLGVCLFWVVYAAWLLATWVGDPAMGNDHRAFASDLAGMLITYGRLPSPGAHPVCATGVQRLEPGALWRWRS